MNSEVLLNLLSAPSMDPIQAQKYHKQNPPPKIANGQMHLRLDDISLAVQ